MSHATHTNPRNRRLSRRNPVAADAEPGLRALLEHLGRLLAKEYVSLLRDDDDRRVPLNKGVKR